ncbi:30S ribosomal protein S18 [Patescibacteria group bacterium]|nr:30S ribosomal protein S18 [Patescibacteria group bacterium]
MARKKSSRKNPPRRPPKKVDFCYFCREDKYPDYKDYQSLKKFLSDRAKIVGSKRSGICSKHQRRLTREIKRARHLGLLPFTPEL